jgi:hypothetical protein
MLSRRRGKRWKKSFWRFEVINTTVCGGGCEGPVLAPVAAEVEAELEAASSCCRRENKRANCGKDSRSVSATGFRPATSAGVPPAAPAGTAGAGGEDSEPAETVDSSLRMRCSANGGSGGGPLPDAEEVTSVGVGVIRTE